MTAWRIGWGILALALAVGCGDKDASATDDDDDGGGDTTHSCPETYFVDADLDGFGGSETVVPEPCAEDAGVVLVSGDCDDADEAVSPDATEVCNGIDDDCDELVDDDDDSLELEEVWEDADGDGWGTGSALSCAEILTGMATAEASGDCDDSDADTYEGAPEDCGEEDRDCDGAIACDDTDCADPACPEVCDNGWDDDADGLADCDDADCFEVDGCFEDCEDNVDNDGDGDRDCDDDECWGDPACDVLEVQVLSGDVREDRSSGFWWTRDWTSLWYRPASYGWTVSYSNRSTFLAFSVSRLRVDDLVGQVTRVRGSSELDCGWGVDVAAWGRSTAGTSTSVASFDLRSQSGFWTSGGCGLSTYQLLPVWALELNRSSLSWDHDGVEDAWLRFGVVDSDSWRTSDRNATVSTQRWSYGGYSYAEYAGHSTSYAIGSGWWTGSIQSGDVVFLGP